MITRTRSTLVVGIWASRAVCVSRKLVEEPRALAFDLRTVQTADKRANILSTSLANLLSTVKGFNWNIPC
jgi:hypothetical protein